ncbi:MAG: acyl-CoA thioesterase [Syntrophobacterales bacterium]|nr:MAG: acyl-CoA thioesterase [Syntrophobacterales bacterium]
METSHRDYVDVDVRVRYAETDQMGVAYYGSYIVWFEVGRSAYLRAKGFSYRELEEMGYILVVVDLRCRYKGAVKYDELIVVRTHLKDVKTRMLTFGYRIMTEGAQEVIVYGETRHLCLNKRGNPRSMPEKFLARLKS